MTVHNASIDALYYQALPIVDRNSPQLSVPAKHKAAAMAAVKYYFGWLERENRTDELPKARLSAQRFLKTFK